MANLPRRPSPEHLRNEARDLQRAVTAGEAHAVARARTLHPRYAQRAHAFRLSDAQLVVARDYGFGSWVRLRTYVEAVLAFAGRPDELGERGDPVDEFLRLACLVYGSDDLTRPRTAAEMLRLDPTLAEKSIHAAAAAGDLVAAKRLLEDDPRRAAAGGGPFGWEPLLYVTYSRVAGAGSDHVAVARLLLERGASPHAGYLWDGTYLFTALTGAFGYGEDAPNQPPHSQAIGLARVLLEAGADPNDDQTIYNRHFREDDDYLELLFAYGLGGPRRGPWPARLGDEQTEPRVVVEDALAFAATNGYADRVALLLRHGVDPDGVGTRHPALKGRRPIESARAHGSAAIVELLRAAGADPPVEDPVADLYGHCLRGDRAAVRELAVHGADLVRRFPDALIEAADRGNLAGIELLLELGFDVNGGRSHTPLHCAAYEGRRAACELLLQHGADLTIRDRQHDGTPAQWARHAHHDELAQFLESR